MDLTERTYCALCDDRGYIEQRRESPETGIVIWCDDCPACTIHPNTETDQ